MGSIATGVCAFAFAYISLLTPQAGASVPAIWLPNAFLLAVLLASPRSRWFERSVLGGLAIAAANIADGSGPVIAVGLAACNVAEYLACAWLIARIIGRNTNFSSTAVVAKFAAITASAAATSAIAATSVLWLATGSINLSTTVVWALADFSGLLVVTPCLLALRLDRQALREWTLRDMWMLGGLTLTALIVFMQIRYPLLFLIPAGLSLVALRARLAVVAAGLLATLSIAAVCTILGIGPLALGDGSIEERILNAQLLLAVSFFVSLPISAKAASERSLKIERDAALGAAVDEARKVRMAQAVAKIGYWRYDLNTGDMIWSEDLYRMLGRDPSEAMTLDLARATIHPDDRRQRVSHFDAWVRGEVEFDHNIYRMVTADGETLYVRGRAVLERDEAGAPQAVFGVIQDMTELEKAERARREAEDRYSLMAETAKDIFVRTDLAGHITYISPACRILGYEPAEMIGLTGAEIVHPDDLERFGENKAQLARDGYVAEHFDRQHRYRCKDGSYLWLEGSPSFFRDAAGNVIEIVNVLRDVTARKAVETQLAESEARYRTLAENVSDILVRFDSRGIVRYISASCRAIGVDPKEAIGKSIMEIAAPEHAAYSAAIAAGLFTGADVDPSMRRVHKIRTRDGRDVWLEGSPKLVRDDSGAVVEVVSVLRDVTARHKIEEALAESEERFRLFAENAADLVMESALDGRIIYVSPSCEAITGFAPADVIGRTATHWMHPDHIPGFIAVVKAQVEGKGKVPPAPYAFRISTKDGRERWMEAQPKAKLDPATGETVSITDVIRDVTERKRLESELRAARLEAEAAAQVKSDFLANMSHELRTPLTSIVGFTRLAGEQGDLSPLTRNYVGRIEDASRALLSVVNDVLDFSKLEAGQIAFKPEPTDLTRLMRASLDLFQPQAGAKEIDLVLESSVADGLTVSIDPDRMRQVLLNLIGNAVKFTSKGRVTLRFGFDTAAQRMRVEVEDTGAGIDDEGLARLFRRFSQVDGSLTRAHGGTGLGLAICKGIVEAMGGQIGVTSEVGRGSRFWFEAPAVQIDATATAVDSDAADIASMGLRVLVVDDHEANRELVSLFLAGVGAEITEAVDGEDAVTLASQMPYDVILMDIRMPRLDGEGALRRIRAVRGPNTSTPILAFTADVGADAAQRMAALGFQGVVGKPVSAEDLLHTVARAAMIYEDLESA